MSNSYRATHTCECGTVIDCIVWPGSPAITSGPADNWDPGSDPDIDPRSCPECDKAIEYCDVATEEEEYDDYDDEE